jgi:hypothetical protein
MDDIKSANEKLDKIMHNVDLLDALYDASKVQVEYLKNCLKERDKLIMELDSCILCSCSRIQLEPYLEALLERIKNENVDISND